MADCVKEVMYDAKRQQLLSTGLDITKHNCYPDLNSVTGKHLYSNKDEPHKLKNLCHGIQGQLNFSPQELERLITNVQEHTRNLRLGEERPISPKKQDLLLPKTALLAVAMSQQRFNHIATIVRGATDWQNVACAEAVFCDPDFVQAVYQTGFPEAALVMLVVGQSIPCSRPARPGHTNQGPLAT